MRSSELTLRGLLTTPFILYVEAIASENGWLRRASFPELDGCEVLAATSWDAVAQLEAELPRYLIDQVTAGRHVPVPECRPIIGNITAEEVLARAGLSAWSDQLDEPVASLALHRA